MSPVPPRPTIYHIIHVDRLPSVVADGCLWCDAEMTQRGGRPGTTIGMGGIKQNRLGLSVTCHPGDRVGEYVPFYFCPRSIMLYVIHCANHPELAYRGGQGPIVHLEADLHEVIEWGDEHGRRWAFSLSNAGARYTTFCSSVSDLDQIDWNAVAARDFRAPEIKEGKQAELLFRESFPWHLVRRIGVYSREVLLHVAAAMPPGGHRPAVELRPDWYY